MSGYWKEDQGEKYVKTSFKPQETVLQVAQYDCRDWTEAGIRKETLKYFKCKTSNRSDTGELGAIFFPVWAKDGKRIVGYQKKDLTIDKDENGHFTAIGSVKNTCMLYGQKQCQHGGKNLWITEGPKDMLSAFQSLKDKNKGTPYAELNPSIVSIVNGTSNADKSIAHNEEFVKSFKKIIVCMDNDCRNPLEPENIIRGKEAEDLIGSYLAAKNVFVPNYPDKRNDLNEILLEDGFKALHNLLMWNIKPFQAEKIITFDEVMTYEDAVAPIPKGFMFEGFEKFNELLSGERYHELTTYTGLPGTGKSTLAFEHIYQQAEAGEKVGLLMLEDPIFKTQRRIAARYLKVHPTPYFLNPKQCATEEKLKKSWEFSIDPEKFMVLAHFGSIAHKPLMSKIKALFAAGCTRILFDHASMAVSGLETNDERKELDILYTELAAFRAAHSVHIKVVSHLDKKAGTQDMQRPSEPKWNYINAANLRGTAGIYQMSDNVVLIHSEILPDASRGRIMIGLGKNRVGAKVGDADIVKMDKNGLFYDASKEIWVSKEIQNTGY